MEYDNLYEELSELTAIDAPTGFEEPLLRVLRDRFVKVCDEVHCDIRGNLYATQKGASADAPVVMMIAHADEIGFMVTRLTGDGFLRFVKLGGPTDMVLPGHRVRVLGTNGPLEGVIGVKPGHILSGDEAYRVPPANKLYIDIGADSADQASSWGVEAGTPAVFRGELAVTQNSRLVFGKAVDDRAGVLALLKSAEKLRSESLSPTVVWCVSVEEEVGLRGAHVAAGSIQPDVVIAVDTAPAGGTPDVEPDELPWTIGKGPLIKVRETSGLSTHGPLRKLFRSMAEKNGIPCQLVVDTAGITDATSAQQAGGQIAALSMSLARRYSHSSVELLDLHDLQALIDLLTVTLPEIGDMKDFLRY